LYNREGKRKGKVHLRTGHEGPEGKERYSFILSLTSVLDRGEGECSRSSPGRLIPMNDPVPFVEEIEWAPGSVWTGTVNISSPLGFDSRTVQSVASRYNDWANPANLHKRETKFNFFEIMRDFYREE